MTRCVDCIHHDACSDWANNFKVLVFPFEFSKTPCKNYSENAAVKYIPSDCKTFIEGVKPEDDYFKILNWYRNLNYKEGNNTERGIMSNAINNLFMDLKNKTAEDKFVKD